MSCLRGLDKRELCSPNLNHVTPHRFLPSTPFFFQGLLRTTTREVKKMERRKRFESSIETRIHGEWGMDRRGEITRATANISVVHQGLGARGCTALYI